MCRAWYTHRAGEGLGEIVGFRKSVIGQSKVVFLIAVRHRFPAPQISDIFQGPGAIRSPEQENAIRQGVISLRQDSFSVSWARASLTRKSVVCMVSLIITARTFSGETGPMV